MKRMTFQEMEDLMYLAKLQLYWKDEESWRTIDWRDAELIAYTEEEVTLRNEDGEERTWNTEEFIDLIHELTELHSKELTEAFAQLRKEGIIK